MMNKPAPKPDNTRTKTIEDVMAESQQKVDKQMKKKADADEKQKLMERERQQRRGK